MTFGKDFTLSWIHYHLEINYVEPFHDLIFFNRELNSLVVLGLKRESSKSDFWNSLWVIRRFSTTMNENPFFIIVFWNQVTKPMLSRWWRRITFPCVWQHTKQKKKFPKNWKFPHRIWEDFWCKIKIDGNAERFVKNIIFHIFLNLPAKPF